MIPLVLVVLGLCLGSFVNAFVWRVHEHRDWVRERSECPSCHHQLAAKDLVPVFSWLWLRGKCRYCGKPIQDTPLAELAVPALFLLSYLVWPEPLHGAGLFRFVLWLVLLVGFVALTLFDLRWFLLPNKVVFPLVGLGAIWVAGGLVLGGSWRDVLGSAAGAAIIAGLFWILFQVSKGKWIGFGDVKLGILLGMLAGGVLQACLVLFIASLTGLLVALPLVLQGKAHRKTLLPFGPLLLAGTIVVQLFGTDIINWYTRLLGF
jgi:leader peptidase (prepilin peptidase) / N-methyltransferase